MNSFSKITRPLSIIISLTVYVIAFFSAVFTARLLPEAHILVRIGMADLVATAVIFIFSRIFNNSSIYDPYWSVKPVVIAMAYIWIFEINLITDRQAILLTGIAFYAFRLTTNFYRDWPGLKHEDWRYVNFRMNFPKAYWVISFFAIHLFPTIMVYLGCLAMYPVFNDPVIPLNGWDIAGIVVLFGSVLLAFIADEQLRIFRKNPANKGKSITRGLWRYSRHPNYLGEILTWWGLFLFAMATGPSAWWTIIGPVSITLMFIFASIPMIERRNLERRTDYLDYKMSTSILIPFKLKLKR
ncbi:MAG: DUF1295 domain-containing protein [Bacteroidales bacterium]|nr:DUF1295 domain-containing protein [Bacteroidales bacterium]